MLRYSLVALPLLALVACGSSEPEPEIAQVAVDDDHIEPPAPPPQPLRDEDAGPLPLVAETKDIATPNIVR